MSRPKLPDDLKVADHIILGFTAEELRKIRIAAANEGEEARTWCKRVILTAASAEDTGPMLAPKLEEDT